MGRSRSGLTSKIHALVDADGRPVALRLAGGQVHDSQEVEALLEAMPQRATLLGDKGYDSNAIREAAAARNAWANIPSRSNRKQRSAFSNWLYRQRNLVENFFNRIKHIGGITRATTSALKTTPLLSNPSLLASGAPRDEPEFAIGSRLWPFTGNHVGCGSPFSVADPCDDGPFPE